MNRFFCVLILIISCSEQEKILPPSSGLYSELIFVADKEVWSEIRTDIFEVFSTHVQGVNQPEAEYNIINVSKNKFTSIFQSHKNIILIDSLQDDNLFRDKWSSPQIVVSIALNDSRDKLNEKLRKTKQILKINELKQIRIRHLSSSNNVLNKNIKDRYGIGVVIPKEYTVVKDTSSLVWAAYNPPNIEEIKHIFIFKFDKKSNNLQNQVLTKVDSIFSKYLLGGPKDSYVKIEPSFEPIIEDNIYRGLWKLENGFMGGPFLIKSHLINEKVIICVGLAFAPGKDKRNYIKTFEAIF